VLSVDEKGLPLKPGRRGTIRMIAGVTARPQPFAALDVLDGTIIGHCMQRH
jgi:hypothetical protein